MNGGERSWPALLGCGSVSVAVIFTVLHNISRTAALCFACVVGLTILIAIIRYFMWKLAEPKDFAYCVFAEFGPEKKIPRQQRLIEKFPRIDPEMLSQWLSDFEKLTQWIGNVANHGGAEALGRKAIELECRERFPWLRRRGLRTAMFLTNYIAAK